MEAKEIRDLMGAYASMYSQQEEVIAEAECECEDEESKKKETPEMEGKMKGKKAEKEKEEKEDKGEKEEVDEATRLGTEARRRAVDLGARRRRTPAYKQGLNRQTGNRERGYYNLANRQSSQNASLETQKMTGDTGAHGHNYADRMDKRDPKKNPKHDANRENVGESFDLFDYLLEYLVAEGYADTNKAALAIMANMSEEWKQSIVEGGINFSVPSRIDDFNNRRDELKNRYKQDVGPRIPGPGGGGQYGQPSAPSATGVRLARGTSSSNRGTETKNNA